MLPSSGALFILWFNPRSLRNVNHPVYHKVLYLTISTAYFLYRDIIIGVWKTIVYTTTYFAFCIWNLFTYMLYFSFSHYLPYFVSILILNNQMFFFLDVTFFLYKIRKKSEMLKLKKEKLHVWVLCYVCNKIVKWHVHWNMFNIYFLSLLNLSSKFSFSQLSSKALICYAYTDEIRFFLLFFLGGRS